MDALTIYAITAGGILVGLFFARILSIIANWSNLFSILYSRHLSLPFVVHRHPLCGPWTRANLLFHVSYAAINVILVFFHIPSLVDAGRRAGELALINLVFPLSTIHLSSLADLLGISWQTCRRIHRATGWMGIALLSFHIVAAVQAREFSFPLRELSNLFTVLGAISLGVLALLAIPYFRRWSYEVFLRGHQILTGLFVYGIWQHLRAHEHSPKIYLFVALGIFGLTSFLQLTRFLYLNGLLAGRGCPRALVSFSVKGSKNEGTVPTAIRIRIFLPRPVKVQAGQYINLWMPSVSLRSWLQTHPFTVTSWSRDKQNTMDLLVQPLRGLTACLLRHAPTAADSSVSFSAFYTGPHGLSEQVDQYESILIIASGFGIAVAIPYLKKMIYGYNTCTSQVRRLHLVWQVDSISEIITAQSLLNNLLEDDILDEGYILNISIYVSSSLEHEKRTFGQHKRVFLYQGKPDYRNIISLEASGDQIERLPNIRDNQGRTLVIVSAIDEIRDVVQETVREHLHQGVKLLEMEYQPSVY